MARVLRMEKRFFTNTHKKTSIPFGKSRQDLYNIDVNKTDNGALDELVKSPPFQGGNYGFESRMHYAFPLARDSTTRMMV